MEYEQKKEMWPWLMHIWTKNVPEIVDQIRKDSGKKLTIACIGPGGEQGALCRHHEQQAWAMM
jgi:aldehyde:ferredoxin oxidoreductase